MGAFGTLITSAEVFGLYFAKYFDHVAQRSFTWRVPHRFACSQMNLQLGTTTTNYLLIQATTLTAQMASWLEYSKQHECESLYRDSCEWQAKFSEIARISEVSSVMCVNVKLNLAMC